ncbi:MAG: glycerol kinase GlpK [Pseudomonadota bacterium]
MTETALLALDQGTTSSRAIVFDLSGRAVATAQQEFAQIYPQPGWVEHDPEVIWATTLTTARKAIELAAAKGYQIACAGLANQRETVVVWERETGRPIHNAIVWQDRRTARRCAQLKQDGAEARVASRTGLVLDPYFSGAKIAWILDHVDGARARAEAGALCAGTIDSFLIHRLTQGRLHVTDATNASRTALYDITARSWDADLLELFNVPEAVLPEVRDCDALGAAAPASVLGQALRLEGAAGDQQAAMIGQACLQPGEMKSTYGTGAFMLVNTGEAPVFSENRLLTTIAWRAQGRTIYALEGSVLSAGATVQWLRDGLGLIAKSSEIESLARAADPRAAVYLVPAFAGLGAPWWAPDARGLITGLTRDSGRAELARAALDSTVYQTADLLDAMAADGADVSRLRVDGGMTVNNSLMQRLADLSNSEVVRPVNTETTAWGAAFLGGLGAGVYSSLDEAAALWRADRRFSPAMDPTERKAQLTGWRKAVERTLA